MATSTTNLSPSELRELERLPLSRSLARLQGGNLAIASERGKGTTCTVTLPPDRAERRN